jgi:hypothetical protein
MLVLVLKNYPQIFAGFTSFAQSSPAPTGAAVPTPTAGFVANPATTSPPTVNSEGATMVSGQLTANPSTLFGLIPTIQGIGKNLGIGAAP